MAEIAPYKRHPIYGKTMKELKGELHETNLLELRNEIDAIDKEIVEPFPETDEDQLRGGRI